MQDDAPAPAESIGPLPPRLIVLDDPSSPPKPKPKSKFFAGPKSVAPRSSATTPMTAARAGRPTDSGYALYTHAARAHRAFAEQRPSPHLRRRAAEAERRQAKPSVPLLPLSFAQSRIPSPALAAAIPRSGYVDGRHYHGTRRAEHAHASAVRPPFWLTAHGAKAQSLFHHGG